MGDNSIVLVPRLDVLPASQRRLWDELAQTPDSFTLYGGTAIALRLGHRFSVDFDFFSRDSFTPHHLMANISYLAGATPRQSSANTLTVTVDRGGPVQVSFFGNLTFKTVAPAEQVEGPGIRVASLLDLAGMKVAVITQRAEVKDYVDIHALLTQARINLPTMLSAGAVIYGTEFNPLIALKALTHYGDPALAELPPGIRKNLLAAARQVNLEQLPAPASVHAGGVEA